MHFDKKSGEVLCRARVCLEHGVGLRFRRGAKPVPNVDARPLERLAVGVVPISLLRAVINGAARILPHDLIFRLLRAQFPLSTSRGHPATFATLGLTD